MPTYRDRTGVLLGTCEYLSLVRRVEDMGYESLCTVEGQVRTAFGKLERAAAVTDRIGLATGIVNVFSRTPTALAQAIGTLDAHSDGRAVLGLGVAHPRVVETFHSVPFDRPLDRIAEYITPVRRYLAGEADSFEGEFYLPERTSFWDAFEPERVSIPSTTQRSDRRISG